MLTTVPTGIEGMDGYGLGIYVTKLPNGISIWGHTGGILRHTWRQAYIGRQFEQP